MNIMLGIFPVIKDKRDLEKALFDDDAENSETDDDDWDLPQNLVT